MSGSLLMPEDRVLSTLNADGTRRWLQPRLSPGRFLTARRAVAYGLIALFVTLPHWRINGKPPMLLDIIRREFTFFGKTFLPTDSLLLAMLVVGLFLTVFAVTALFGRVWCGWGCPQTVYLEFVFRPIERVLGGEKSLGGERYRAALKGVRLVVYCVLSFVLANTFLAYFVGTDQLWQWIGQSPISHPTGFLVVMAVTALMLFDFGFFREQTCFIACPYGRFQSVMLDRHSLIVTYDLRRGEPRGRGKRAAGPPTRSKTDVALPVLAGAGAGALASGHGPGATGLADAGVAVAEGGPSAEDAPVRGDCVDCFKCVTTCPTGIDIRNGLQMECIGCAQCIDACDAVMDKLGRPRGLVRYSSQSVVEGESERIFRPRVVVYGTLLALIAAAVVWVLLSASPADVSLLRSRGMPFNIESDGTIANQMLVKITNRTDRPAEYRLSVVEPTGGVRLQGPAALSVGPGEIGSGQFLVLLEPGVFKGTTGRRDVRVRVGDGAGVEVVGMYRALGPADGRLPGEHREHGRDGDRHGDGHEEQVGAKGEHKEDGR
jgi:polyferredoxin